MICYCFIVHWLAPFMCECWYLNINALQGFFKSICTWIHQYISSVLHISVTSSIRCTVTQRQPKSSRQQKQLRQHKPCIVNSIVRICSHIYSSLKLSKVFSTELLEQLVDWMFFIFYFFKLGITWYLSIHHVQTWETIFTRTWSLSLTLNPEHIRWSISNFATWNTVFVHDASLITQFCRGDFWEGHSLGIAWPEPWCEIYNWFLSMHLTSTSSSYWVVVQIERCLQPYRIYKFQRKCST